MNIIPNRAERLVWHVRLAWRRLMWHEPPLKEEDLRTISAGERAICAVYILLLMLAFGLAGANDLREEERLSLKGYIAERATDRTNCR